MKLKKIRSFPSLLLIATLLLLGFSLQAQTYYSFTPIWGTNAQPILLHFSPQSNSVLQQIQGQTLVVTNISTNEAIYVAYGSGQTPFSSTNLSQLNTLTGFWTNFPASMGWTNGSTWTYNVPPFGGYAPLYPYGILAVSNGVYSSGTQTNGVNFQ